MLWWLLNHGEKENWFLIYVFLQLQLWSLIQHFYWIVLNRFPMELAACDKCWIKILTSVFIPIIISSGYFCSFEKTEDKPANYSIM